MIQSKNKFLPPLYIRKCKITYLECFAILQRAGCYGQLLLVFKSMTSHLHATRGCVLSAWMSSGWMGEGWTEVRLEPCEVLRTRMQTTGRWTHIVLLVSRLAQNMVGYIARRAKSPVPGGEGGSVISAEVKRKQKPNTGGNKTVAHSTSCQRKCQSEGGVWFPPTSYGSWAGKLRSVHPIARQVGTSFKWLHTFLCSSLENTSATGGRCFSKV